MQYLKDFPVKSNRAVWRYDIRVENETITIRYKEIPGSKRHLTYPDEKMLISQMHIANIPAVVGAIFKVFQMKDGGSVGIYEHGDELAVIMHFDDHSQFKDLVLRDRSRRIRNGLPNQMEFVFEDYMSINTPPLPRTPTPAMIWVTDTLKKIHEEWEERKKGKKE